jgi:hypothetical protein
MVTENRGRTPIYTWNVFSIHTFNHLFLNTFIQIVYKRNKIKLKPFNYFEPKYQNITPMHPHYQLPIPSRYLICGGRAHLILHPPHEIMEVFDTVTFTQPLTRHAEEGLYDTQCARTIAGTILLNNELLISRPTGWCLNPLHKWD